MSRFATRRCRSGEGREGNEGITGASQESKTKPFFEFLNSLIPPQRRRTKAFLRLNEEIGGEMSYPTPRAHQTPPFCVIERKRTVQIEDQVLSRLEAVLAEAE